jgi:hypothetical protein
MQVGHRLGHRGVDGGGIKDAVGAGGGPPRLLLRPAIAGGDKAQVK